MRFAASYVPRALDDFFHQESMIRKTGYRFSEKHALGLDPRDHAQTERESGMTIRRKVIAL
jgi:hypothetical protein